MRVSTFALVPALVFLAGCTAPSFTMPPGTPEYRAGYHKGCTAGYSLAGSPFVFTPDDEDLVPPPKGDPHRVGWLAGHDRCKQKYRRMQKAINSVLGPG